MPDLIPSELWNDEFFGNNNLKSLYQDIVFHTSFKYYQQQFDTLIPRSKIRTRLRKRERRYGIPSDHLIYFLTNVKTIGMTNNRLADADNMIWIADSIHHFERENRSNGRLYGERSNPLTIKGIKEIIVRFKKGQVLINPSDRGNEKKVVVITGGSQFMNNYRGRKKPLECLKNGAKLEHYEEPLAPMSELLCYKICKKYTGVDIYSLSDLEVDYIFNLIKFEHTKNITEPRQKRVGLSLLLIAEYSGSPERAYLAIMELYPENSLKPVDDFIRNYLLNFTLAILRMVSYGKPYRIIQKDEYTIQIITSDTKTHHFLGPPRRPSRFSRLISGLTRLKAKFARFFGGLKN